jgi:hypothetical protein
MPGSYWRRKYRPIIAKILEATKGQADAQILTALRNAFPDLPRQHHPYKMWLREAQVQRGIKSERRPKQTPPYETIGDGDLFKPVP